MAHVTCTSRASIVHIQTIKNLNNCGNCSFSFTVSFVVEKAYHNHPGFTMIKRSIPTSVLLLTALLAVSSCLPIQQSDDFEEYRNKRMEEGKSDNDVAIGFPGLFLYPVNMLNAASSPQLATSSLQVLALSAGSLLLARYTWDGP